MNLNTVQKDVLSIISQWGKCEKSPIPQEFIIDQMVSQNTAKESTIKATVRTLIKKGYIRKAISYQVGISYVQLRSL